MTTTSTSEQQRHQLLDLVRKVINHGVSDLARIVPDAQEFAVELRGSQASFVTLTGPGRQLRGCCGNLEPHAGLVTDLADNAWRTAFADHRFDPVTKSELDRLAVEIALLTPLTEISASSRAALLRTLQPGIDGLLICADGRRATFLPKVWSSLPEPEDFLDQLLRKANLVGWPGGLQAWRYGAESFAGPLLDIDLA